MKVSFVYEGHEITVSREMLVMYLYIDDEKVDSVKGLFKSSDDCEMHGKITGADGKEKQVEVQFKSAGLKELRSKLSLLVDGQLIDVKQIL